MRLNTLALLTSVNSLNGLDARSSDEYEPLNGLNQTTYEFSLDPEPLITNFESEAIRDFNLPFSDNHQYIEYIGHFSSPNDDTFDVNLVANCTTYTNFDFLNVEALASHPLDISSLLSSPHNATINAHANEKYPLFFSLFVPALEHVAVQLEITNLNTSEKLNFSDLVFAPDPMDMSNQLFARDSDSNITSNKPLFAAMATPSAASTSTVSTANESSTSDSNSQTESETQTEAETDSDSGSGSDSDSENETLLGAVPLVSGVSSNNSDDDQSVDNSSSSDSQASNEDITLSNESNVSSSALDSSISSTSETPTETLTTSSQEGEMKKSAEYEQIRQSTSSSSIADQIAEPTTSVSSTLNTSVAAPKSEETSSEAGNLSSSLNSSSNPESSSSILEAGVASQASETSSTSTASEVNPTSEATSTITSVYTSSDMTKTVEVPVFPTETSKAHSHQSSSESYSNISIPSQILSGSSKSSTSNASNNTNANGDANGNGNSNAEQQTGSGAPIVTTMVQVSTLHSVITVNKNTIDFQYLTSSTITTTLPADYVFSSTERRPTTVSQSSASAPTNSSLRSKTSESESRSTTKSKNNGAVRLQPLLRFCALPLSVALFYGF